MFLFGWILYQFSAPWWEKSEWQTVQLLPIAFIKGQSEFAPNDNSSFAALQKGSSGTDQKLQLDANGDRDGYFQWDSQEFTEEQIKTFIHSQLQTLQDNIWTRKHLVAKEYLVEKELRSIWLEMRVFWKRFPPCNPRAVQLRILKAMMILPNLYFSLSKEIFSKLILVTC